MVRIREESSKDGKYGAACNVFISGMCRQETRIVHHTRLLSRGIFTRLTIRVPLYSLP